MKVKDLIDELTNLDPEANVSIRDQTYSTYEFDLNTNVRSNPKEVVFQILVELPYDSIYE